MASKIVERVADEHAAQPVWDAQAEQQVDALTEQAKRCRRLASVTYDREVSQMLDTMARDFERSAGELSTRRDA